MEPDGVEYRHIPVLCSEVVGFLTSRLLEVVVDGTVGLGGHAEAILEADERVRLVGIDRDERALRLAGTRLARFGPRVTLIPGNFADLEAHLERLDLGTIGGVLLDLGVSSLQLDDEERGFSLRSDGPLDMRMDQSSGPTAAEWLAGVSVEELQDVLWRYGEERYAGRIARAIGRARDKGRIETTGALVRAIHGSVPGRYFAERIDPATRSFQAIRIFINGELDHLSAGLAAGFRLLSCGGVLVVISFHSLEDRIVKQFMRRLAAECTCPPGLPECLCGKQIEAEILTRRPIVASDDEASSNSRARSAKLRACRKVA